MLVDEHFAWRAHVLFIVSVATAVFVETSVVLTLINSCNHCLLLEHDLYRELAATCAQHLLQSLLGLRIQLNRAKLAVGDA